MGLYYNEDGSAVQVDDDYAARMGYRPVDAAALTAVGHDLAQKQAVADSGTLGAIRTGVTNLASGATVGATDWLLGQFLDPSEKQQLLTDQAAHPYISGAANLVGAIAPSLVAPESLLGRSPAGYLGRAAMGAAEGGFEAGGLAGAARVAGAFGAEGAIQNAGSYIGATALEDKDATAEGLAGAAGLGFAFGAGGGLAGLGIEKGTIAARKLFARTVGSGEVADAASAWARTYGATQQAEQSALDIAKKQLNDIGLAKIEATKALQAETELRKAEQVRARNATPRPEAPSSFGQGVEDFAAAPAGEPLSLEPMPSRPAPVEAAIPETGMPVPETGMPVPETGTPAVPRAAADITGEDVITVPAKDIAAHGFESDSVPGVDKVKTDKGRKAIAEGQRDPIEIAVSPGGKYQVVDGTHRLAGAVEAGADVQVRFVKGASGLDEAAPSKYVVKGAETDLEQQLVGTKAQLDEGKSIKDVRYGEDAVPGSAVSPQIPPSKTPPPYEGRKMASNSIEDWLSEKAASDAGELSQVRRAEDIRGQRQYQSFAEMQHARTSERLGPKIADKEMALTKFVKDVETAAAPVHAMEKAAEEGITAEQLATLRADNGTFGGKPVHARKAVADKLESAHEYAANEHASALEAGDSAAAADWGEQADHVERLIHDLPHEKDIYWDLGDKIKIVDRWEEALSKAPEVLGEDAHPLLHDIAKQRAAANDDAVRKMSERSVRAAEDAEHFGPEYKTPKERVQYAQEREAEARKALNDIKIEGMRAQRDVAASNEKVKTLNKAEKAAKRLDAKTQKTKDWGSLIGGGAEFLNIPGIPKPSDLPVIGPLVGAWLKYRAIKAAFRRIGGRIPFNGDARVAALAAKTEGRVAKAVDTALGLAERGTKAAIEKRVVPNAVRILGTRIYDDGGENPPPNAGVQQHAAARMREIAAYAASPNAIEMDVRLKLRDVSDPDVIVAAEKQRRALFMYLASKLPPMPPSSPLDPRPWLPSGAEALAFGRRMTAAGDPAGVFERVSVGQGVGLEEMETVRDLYTSMYAKAQTRLMEGMTRLKIPVPYRQRVMMSLLYDMPLDPALSAENLKISQSVYDRKMIAPPGAPTQPPTPSIAQPTNLTQLFTNPLDRMR